MIAASLAAEEGHSALVELRSATPIPTRWPDENFNKTFRNKQTSWRLDELAAAPQSGCYRKRRRGHRKNYSAVGNWFTKQRFRSFPVCRIGVIEKVRSMKRPIFIACTACAALFICVALRAADDNKSDSTSSSANSANDNNAALFDRLDANHDGQITADEVPEEHRGLFERLLRRADRNGDGKLSREEFMSGLADDQPGRPAARPGGSSAGGLDQMRESAKIREYAASIIKQYDTNGDGVLDKSEWSKMKNAERYDRNHDGKITLEEIIETMSTSQPAVEDPSAMNRERGPMDGGFGNGGNGGFGRGGGFGGGGGGMAGGGVGPFMGTALFRALDTNNDGKLDAKEIAAAADVLKKLANSNGEITREELLQSLPPGAGPGAGGGGGRGGLWRDAWRRSRRAKIPMVRG